MKRYIVKYFDGSETKVKANSAEEIQRNLKNETRNYKIYLEGKI